MNFFALILTSITFFSTLFGGFLATKYKMKIDYFVAFAAGVLIGISMFELLPEALKLAENLNYPIEILMYVTILGFVFLSLNAILLFTKYVTKIVVKMSAILKEEFMVPWNYLLIVFLTDLP